MSDEKKVDNTTTIADYPPPPAYDIEDTTSRNLQPQFQSPAGPPPSLQQPYNPPPDPRGFHSPFSSPSPAIPPATSSFSRLPPPHLPYNGFPPAYLISRGRHLESGFDVMPPPSLMMPHPFETHDVNEGDWTKFLGDLQRSAALTAQNRPSQSISRSASDTRMDFLAQRRGGRGGLIGSLLSAASPPSQGGDGRRGLEMGGRDNSFGGRGGRRGLGGSGGLIGGLISVAVSAASSSKPPNVTPNHQYPNQYQGQPDNGFIPINQLVDTWNQNFFRPRRIEVVLAHGPLRIDSGPGPVPPLDPYREQNVSSGGGSDSDSSSSSSSTENEDRHGHRASKRIDRAERRRLRAERKGRRRGRGGLGVPEYRRGRSHDDHLGRGSGSGKDRWRVFITSV